jgi:hypothetical protein
VYDAQLVEQRLLKTGRLTRPLTPEGRARLARLFYVAPDHFAVHDRPTKYLWRDIEKVLRDDGALADGTLDAWSVLRGLEPALEGANITRAAGHFIAPFVFVSAARGHVDEDQIFDTGEIRNGVPVSSSHTDASLRQQLRDDRAGVGVEVLVARPVSMRTHTQLSLQATAGSHDQLALRTIARAFEILADRWYTELDFQHDVSSERSHGARLQPVWLTAGQVQLGYFLEDAWSAHVNWISVQNQERAPVSGASFYSRNSQVTVGLTYRPFGRFDAPGVGVFGRHTRTVM